MGQVPRRFSAIGHDGILLWNPLPEAETLRLVDGLDVPPAARVLDIGCGRAELLIRLVARTGAHGVGVDPWPHAISMARAAAAGRVDPSRLDLREESFDATKFGDASVDVALCIGAISGFRSTLKALRRLLVPGGTAIVGEGHWLREPDPEYLAFLEGSRDEFLDHAGNLAAACEEGFDVVRSIVSTADDWDRYTGRLADNMERFVAEHPDDPDVDAFRRRLQAGRTAYLRWGRETLGFALYVLRRT